MYGLLLSEVANNELLSEWDYDKNGDLTPNDVTIGAHKQVWWLCEKGHSYKAAVNNKVYRGSGCPYCSGRLPIVGETDLATTRPDLVAQLVDQSFATKVSSGAHKKLEWRCKSGHVYTMPVYKRSSGSDCPYCSGRKVLKGFNDLSTLRPDVAQEWDFEKNDLDIFSVGIGSHKIVWWKCVNGHSYQLSINKRMDGRGCPYCSNRKVWFGYNDLFTIRPDIAEEWDYENNDELRPNDIYYRSDKKVWWLCSEGHHYKAAVYMRTRTDGKSSGCPYCSGRKALKGFNDLLTICPDVATEWDYKKNGDLKSTDVTFGSGKKVWWLCSKGHSYQATISNRTVNGSGCPYCSNNAVLSGFNDLVTVCPDVMSEWDYERNEGINPNELSKSSNLKVWWLCPNGHSYFSSVHNRVSGWRCSVCGESYGERDVRAYLMNTVLIYQSQWTNEACRFINVLPFDFAIFSDKSSEIPIACIEYQGEQHYHPVDAFGGKKSFESQQKRDAIKREFCEQNGIPLILIPFSFNTQELVNEMLDVCFKELGIK